MGENQENMEGNDMPKDMRDSLTTIFKESIQETDDLNEIAQKIKQSFDNKYFEGWNCIVGRQFGSSVTAIEKTHFFERIGPLYIEVWQCK
ncbi:Dynein light chain type 1 family protein [Trichomonas vaginalis G3]|uniref:Dynein light chain n=1 Tax=Trichomonas vaginalis (strain ATCC PRA-98 / G3) TaxID=412133 RepID=A2H7N0_TRIV3|nr:dynein light 2 family [Trichomonas vaginalis G3]EAX74587.1 Dynein light chain type 1 family protein [Trichomonas vaginalis G3]KAI5553291.1 dynein light 2 family [Trichomonas vaginalis G3]|eukprot:XP_001287517.1 Dynein light chain type 1 family protein [Trichomonas vaginalis G3]